MINRVEHALAKNFIRREFKPENLLIELGKKANQVHILDFGLAQPYRAPKSQQHIPDRANLHLTGTARYASGNTHLGIEQSRRDDLEAVGYVLTDSSVVPCPGRGCKRTRRRRSMSRSWKRRRPCPGADVGAWRGPTGLDAVVGDTSHGRSLGTGGDLGGRPDRGPWCGSRRCRSGGVGRLVAASDCAPQRSSLGRGTTNS